MAQVSTDHLNQGLGHHEHVVDKRDTAEEDFPELTDLKDIMNGLIGHFSRPDDADVLQELIDTEHAVVKCVDQLENDPRHLCRGEFWFSTCFVSFLNDFLTHAPQTVCLSHHLFLMALC